MDNVINTLVIKESEFSEGNNSSMSVSSVTRSISKTQKAIVQAINCQGSVFAMRTYLWDGESLSQISYKRENSGSVNAISFAISEGNVVFTLTGSIYKVIHTVYIN